MDAFILLALSFAEQAEGIPKGLLTSLCTVESSGNPKAVHKNDGGGRDSLGLCQLQLRSSREVCPLVSAQLLLEPAPNALCAARYLKKQIRRYKSLTGGIIAYNKGSWSGGATNHYHKKVMREYAKTYANKRKSH